MFFTVGVQRLELVLECVRVRVHDFSAHRLGYQTRLNLALCVQDANIVGIYI